MISSLIESLRWTIIIPLPVIMELDGLSANTSQLGEAVDTAMSYISSHIWSQSQLPAAGEKDLAALLASAPRWKELEEEK